MGESTAISWTDSTWNPWQGCHKVSPGCRHCYAERIVRDRMGRDFRVVRRSSPSTFGAPLRWKGPRRVFTCSISDFFIEEADVWRGEAWEVIRRTPSLTYQILTKRPDRIEGALPLNWGGGWSNVWLGTSVETQLYENRIEVLSRVPAAVHFLSCEPLLGPITFRRRGRGLELLRGIQWVIAGGESGPGFRAASDEWFEQIRDQCAEAGVPFWFKQHPGFRSESDPELDGREWRQMPGWPP